MGIPDFFKLTVQLLYRAFNQNSFQFISGKNTGRASLKLKTVPFGSKVASEIKSVVEKFHNSD
ncbi:hypothetical protein LEP1GSC116_1351 [Leptospira interrogans serovar Icterohaemorrhagiae str. Verdun HP]|uniref:Uncharacterized protein n=1 Tax=Leptospira interrogans serovar Icterohaemorrhagiae str. Verdun HP TaxID=1049910 RepID=M6RT85_LEPIR|nr:hypothetical protein LEP1GSC116_1351 [Leptospira interrogans serovar Icterohaemorrhagiae str. Verdun HP]